MALPTSYTAESFAAYIKTEVIQYVGDVMDWGVVSAQAAEVLATITLYANANVNAAYVELTTVPERIGIGSEITFTGDAQKYRVAEVGFADDAGTRVFVRLFPYIKIAKLAGVTGTFPVTATTRETHPVYRSILDEALLAIGLEDVAEATSEEQIVRLRMQGRIEAWRAVMCNCVSMTSSESQEGNFFNRAQVYFSARDQMQLAEQEYGRVFGLSPTLQPDFITSGVSTVKGAW